MPRRGAGKKTEEKKQKKNGFSGDGNTCKTRISELLIIIKCGSKMHAENDINCA